jgi:predicted transposase YdaD
MEKQKSTYAQDVLRGFDKDCSKLAIIFFSEQNIEIIQRSIILKAYREKQCRIPHQKTEDILLIMRRIYREQSDHVDCNFTEQIRTLNTQVLDAVFPSISAAIDSHLRYLQDIDTTKRVFVPTPQNTKTRRSLPSITSIWK